MRQNSSKVTLEKRDEITRAISQPFLHGLVDDEAGGTGAESLFRALRHAFERERADGKETESAFGEVFERGESYRLMMRGQSGQQGFGYVPWYARCGRRVSMHFDFAGLRLRNERRFGEVAGRHHRVCRRNRVRRQ